LLVEIYGAAEIEELIAATDRLRKKLGGLRTQEAIDLLRQKKLAQAVDLVLDYYDKTYQYDLEKRKVPIHTIDMAGLSADTAAKLLVEKSRYLTADSDSDYSSHLLM
jgi:tRNA 2-selenouridine synthase